MTVDTVLASKDSRLRVELDTYVESFLRHLRTVGYAKRTLCGKRTIAESFARWTRRQQIAVEDLKESHIAAFVERSGQRPKARAACELAVLRSFLDYIRAEAGMPTAPLRIDSSATSQLKQRYEDYLRTGRGLTERSVCIYLPFIHDLVIQFTLVPLDSTLCRDMLTERSGFERCVSSESA